MAGGLAYAQMQAMQKAAGNAGGAMNGFVGLGLANQAMGGAAAQGNLMETAKELQAKKAPAPAPAGGGNAHVCPSCGAKFEGRFCPECGTKFEEEDTWTCSCGHVCTGKFCPECGKQRPAGYTCSCGYHADAPFKFCPECGKKAD